MSEEPEAAEDRPTQDGQDRQAQEAAQEAAPEREQTAEPGQDHEGSGEQAAEAPYPGPEPVAYEEQSPDLGAPEVASADDPLASPEDTAFPEPGVTPGPAEELDRETPDERGLTTETSSSG